MKREISPFIRLNQKDNVVVARRDVPAGMEVESEGFTTRTEVPAGYKAAARDIRKGEPILKYNTCIGFAAEDTPAGTMMHSHNIVFEHVDLDYAFSRDYHPTELLPPEQRATFQGFVRPDGWVATRNYIGILVASNCAAPWPGRSPTTSPRSVWPPTPTSAEWCPSSPAWAAAWR